MFKLFLKKNIYNKINTVNKIKFIYLNTTAINTYNIVNQYGQLWQKGGCTIYYFFLKYD